MKLRKNKTGYSPGNFTDITKQELLSMFLEDLLKESQRFFKYFDLFAGAGIYYKGTNKEFKGAAILVLETISSSNRDFKAYLNEKNKTLREELQSNVQQFSNNVEVFGAYQNYIKEYIKKADKDSLFLIDPTKLKDYEDKGKTKGILYFLNDLLKTEAKLFLYAPESVGIEQAAAHKKIIEKILQTIENSGREYSDFKPDKNYTKGFLERVDHNIIVF